MNRTRYIFKKLHGLLFLFLLVVFPGCNTEQHIVTNKKVYWDDEVYKLLEKQKSINEIYFVCYRDSIFPNELVSQFENLEAIQIRKCGPDHFTDTSKTSFPSLHIDTTKRTKINKLKKIEFNFVGLDSFPSSFGQFDSLKTLNLSFCDLNTIPSDISGFYNLTLLELSGNNLKTLPDSFQAFSNLLELDLNNNMLKKIPLVLFQMPHLQKVWLANREGTGIPFIHTNEIDYILEKDNLLALLKKESIKKVYIQVKDCKTKKEIKEMIGDKNLLEKLHILPRGICNFLFN